MFIKFTLFVLDLVPRFITETEEMSAGHCRVVLNPCGCSSRLEPSWIESLFQGGHPQLLECTIQAFSSECRICMPDYERNSPV